MHDVCVEDALPAQPALTVNAWLHDTKVKFEADSLAGNEGEHLLALPVYMRVLRRLCRIHQRSSQIHG